MFRNLSDKNPFVINPKPPGSLPEDRIRSAQLWPCPRSNAILSPKCRQTEKNTKEPSPIPGFPFHKEPLLIIESLSALPRKAFHLGLFTDSTQDLFQQLGMGFY